MYVDPSGMSPLPWWGKVLIGVGIIAVLAVGTVLTGGIAAGLAGAIFAGALKGAIITGISSAVISAGIGYLTGGVDGMLEGIGNGFLTGVISGAVIGGAVGGLTYSPLKAASNAANKAFAGKNFNINKHLGNAGGRWSKFLSNSSDDILKSVQSGLKTQNVSFLKNGSKSFKMIVDFGTQVGTKGETSVRVIIGYGGKIWTMFPV